MFPRLDSAERLAFDCEATGLYYPRDKIFGFSITLPDRSSYYYDIRRQPEAKRWWNNEMKTFRGTMYAHHAHFDAKMWYGSNMDLPLERVRCTQIQACLINEHEFEYGLDALAKKYLKSEKVADIYPELAKLFGGSATRKAQMPNLHKAPPELVGPYACRDTELVLDLSYWQDKEIERQGLQEIVAFEQMIFPTIQRMIRRGVRVDVDKAARAMEELAGIIAEDQKRLNELVGFDVNVNSSPQIKKIFEPVWNGHVWVARNGYEVEKTDKGQPSIPSPVLRKMENDPIAKLIVDIRSNIKTKDTFLAGHVIGHEVGGRVYPTINQNKGEDGGTGSGRLSYTDPALQQIPSRNKRVASIVKDAFLPEEGHRWLSTDIASCDVRCFAHLVNNDKLNAEYAKNPELDLHQYVADLCGIVRNATYNGQANAKQLNLSAIFNTGKGAIAETLGMPFTWETFTSKGETITYKKAGKEAEELIALYHSRVPGVKELAERAKKVAEQRGYVRTHSGRRMRFPRGYKSYKASGLIIQGTAADINKEALVLEEQALEEFGGLMMLNVHDSFEASVPLDQDMNKVWPAFQGAFQNGFPWLRVPMILELNGTGRTYWEATSAKGEFRY